MAGIARQITGGIACSEFLQSAARERPTFITAVSTECNPDPQHRASSQWPIPADGAISQLGATDASDMDSVRADEALVRRDEALVEPYEAKSDGGEQSGF